MRQSAKALTFVLLLTLLVALQVATSAEAASLSRQCRKACGDGIAACVAAGGHPRACRKDVLGRCKREGVAVCEGQAGQISAALAGDCSSPTVIPAPGGTFSGTTSGTSALAGSCGRSGESPERVFQWTPTVSGTATIQTCGAATTFDTVLYLRSGVCSGGPEVAAGCNDDTCPNATGLFRASRITPTVTAGQTYFIVVDGYGGAQGTFSLTVTPPEDPVPTTTTTLPGGGACSSPTAIPAPGGTFSGTTSGTSALAGSCGSSGDSPEKVFQWTPTVSGTATIQTCGAGTSFDTVLYLRSGVCASGPEVAAGCNDDACANASGLVRGSRITPTVTAGQTYFIVVDGYAGAQGAFSLTVTPPGDPAPTTTTTLPGGAACSSPTAIPAPGGTFSGTTSGTSALAGSCGSSENSPERVYQWTPAVSGTATIQTCGAGTSFDTVLYLRSGVCASGPEMAAGCNDDACVNASGLLRASRITPTVTAGQTYFIVVDGYGGATGTFTLTVTPPGASTTTTTLPPSTTTTRPPTTTSSSTTTTTTRPPTTTSSSTTTTSSSTTTTT